MADMQLGVMRPRASSSLLLKGTLAGLLAGIPQVLLSQMEARLLPISTEQADIGPRFVKRVSERTDARLGTVQHWVVAGLFHFGYSAAWGALYGLLQRWRPAQPHVGGPLLGALIYTLAFSPWGAATQTDTERPVESRRTYDTLLHWTAALSFSLCLAYLYSAWEPVPDRWRRLAHTIRPGF